MVKNRSNLEGALVLIFFAATLSSQVAFAGILQARPSETREMISLDGLWYFTANASLVQNIEEADDLEINLMPVPSSYNDISTKLSLRDHVGSVWYKRSFFVPSSWRDKRVWIRFGSVCYNASATINGFSSVTHSIGHLPFAAEISLYLRFGDENTVYVEVNNILTNTTIPQGEVRVVNGVEKLFYDYDFFHYGGIDRPVLLYTTSSTYVDDIDIHTDVDGTTGLVSYNLEIAGDHSSVIPEVNILDKKGNIVVSDSSQNTRGTLKIENATFWWPYLMDPNPGYLYSFEVMLRGADGQLIDHYKEPFGIRRLKYDNASFTINGKNIYLRGFGRHEDADIRGKGLDLPMIIRDHHLIKWIGANCYRTSHYPYAEEIMDLADELGIMIIDEVPAVHTIDYNDELLENHKRSWTELYRRDKNRPAVVMWSIANEPETLLPESEDYYRQVSAHVKSHDTSRPITLANMEPSQGEYSGQFMDILGLNRYQGWYGNVGEISVISFDILQHARDWHAAHNKPVMFTEYGADSLEGLSSLPTYVWSEKYQNDLMSEYFKTFDTLRSEGWFIGEMIWCFADFKTNQNVKRVGGNKKGVFTRRREPKQAAYLLRKRYWSLAQRLDNATMPSDLDPYVIAPL